MSKRSDLQSQPISDELAGRLKRREYFIRKILKMDSGGDAA